MSPALQAAAAAMVRCICGHTLAQHHPAQLSSRCRACAPCQGFVAQEAR